MLFYLNHPAVLLGLALGLLGAVLAHNLVQAVVARSLGDPEAAKQGWLTPKPGRHLDPFGAVGMVLTGQGWPAAVPMSQRWRARKGRLATALAAGPLAALITGLIWFGMARLATADSVVVVYDRSGFAHAIGANSSQVLAIVLAAGSAALGVGVLTLFPLLPLAGGRIMFALAPPTAGWQKARYQLEERNLGEAFSLLVVMLPLLLATGPIVGQLAGPLIAAVARLVGLSVLA